MNSNPIGVFDSGIGGLTVLKELEEKLPNENYIYFGDTLNFPYGEKSSEEIISFCKKNIEYLIKQKVKCVVIACGTATSQALNIVQNEFNIPIIGIIDPTVKYVKTLNLKKIGVIATTGTINSGAWEKNLKNVMPNLKVISKACPLLASIAEDGIAQSKESKNTIHKYMQIFKDNDVDTIILGCTHYPICDELIREEFKNNIELINTGKAVVTELSEILKVKDLQNTNEKIKTKIIISKEDRGFKEKAKNILKSSKTLDITKFY